MAKVCALAGSMVLAAYAARITKVSQEDVISNHCANFNGYNYAKCSVLDGDTNLLDAVCGSKLEPSQIIEALKSDKCIRCNAVQLKAHCEGREITACTSDQLGDNEELICKMSVFGLSEKEREVTPEGLQGILREQRIGCTQKAIDIHCAKREWPTCDSLTFEGKMKEHFCGLVRTDSAERAVAGIGARLGIQCSNAEIRTKCGKDTCAKYGEDEWEAFCEGKAKAGKLASEAVELAAEDGLTCSEAEIKAKCPLPCAMDEATEKTVCFGYSGKGRKVEAKSPKHMLEIMGLSRKCEVNEVKVHCFEKDWPKCDTLSDETKGAIKEHLCGKRGSAMSNELGGRFGVFCSEEDLDGICGK